VRQLAAFWLFLRPRPKYAVTVGRVESPAPAVAQAFFPAQTRYGSPSFVGVEAAPLRVGQEHANRHRLDEGPEALFAFAKRLLPLSALRDVLQHPAERGRLVRGTENLILHKILILLVGQQSAWNILTVRGRFHSLL